MSLVRQDPFRFMNRIQDDLNELFRLNGRRRLAHLYDEPMGMAGPDTEWAPMMDIRESDNSLVVTADLAGVDPKDVEVFMEGNELVIKGERKQTHKEDSENYRLREIEYGAFERRFTMPDTVDPEKIDARSEGGVLTITMGKQAASQRKQIQIKS